jgi:hypothetical protein
MENVFILASLSIAKLECSNQVRTTAFACYYSFNIIQNIFSPDTEYKFEIVAITSEGKCRSKIAKVRTLKDECNILYCLLL